MVKLGVTPCCGAPLLNPIQHNVDCQFHPTNTTSKVAERLRKTEELVKATEFIKDACIFFGGKISTAYMAAGLFAESIEHHGPGPAN